MVLLRVCHPCPLQPVPRALEGRGASVLRRPPRSHQDPDLREGDVGRKGRSSLSLGLQVPTPTRHWGPAPGDTEGQRGLTLSMSVVIHLRVLCLDSLAVTPALPCRGHGPSKAALGTHPSPCVLSACAAQRELKTQ